MVFIEVIDNNIDSPASSSTNVAAIVVPLVIILIIVVAVVMATVVLVIKRKQLLAHVRKFKSKLIVYLLYNNLSLNL